MKKIPIWLLIPAFILRYSGFIFLLMGMTLIAQTGQTAEKSMSGAPLLMGAIWLFAMITVKTPYPVFSSNWFIPAMFGSFAKMFRWANFITIFAVDKSLQLMGYDISKLSKIKQGEVKVDPAQEVLYVVNVQQDLFSHLGEFEQREKKENFVKEVVNHLCQIAKPSTSVIWTDNFFDFGVYSLILTKDCENPKEVIDEAHAKYNKHFEFEDQAA